MIKVHEYLQQEKWLDKVKLVLQVHDELVYEVKDNLVDEVIKEIKKIMETVVDTKKTHGVVCVAEAAVGQNWAEMERK